MLHSTRILGFFVLAASFAGAVAAAGCGSDDSSSTPTADGGPQTDSSASDGATPDGGGDASKLPTTFLDPSEYAELLAIDPAFPYGVTGKHAADGTITKATKWGHHGGPLVTNDPNLSSWTIPADPRGQATVTTKAFAVASDVLPGALYGSDGFVDLAFTGALQSYSTSTAPNFPGEALLYAPTYDSVTSRAKVNGFYSGTGVVDGATQALVYSGLSTPSATDTTMNENGLYAAPLCAGQLVATGACAVAHKLFGWTGGSGPVTADTAGDVFVAAYVTGGASSDVVYGVSKTQALAAAAPAQTTVTEQNTMGTATVAAALPKGGTEGWVVGIGFPAGAGLLSPAWAASYTPGATLTKGTAITGALKPAASVGGFALFTDDDGNLWIAVTRGGTEGTFLKLERKPL